MLTDSTDFGELDIHAGTRIDFGAMGLGYGLGSLSALADTCTIVRVDPSTNSVSKRYTICNVESTNAATAAVTIAFGSLWFAFPDAHTLWRIQP